MSILAEQMVGKGRPRKGKERQEFQMLHVHAHVGTWFRALTIEEASSQADMFNRMYFVYVDHADRKRAGLLLAGFHVAAQIADVATAVSPSSADALVAIAGKARQAGGGRSIGVFMAWVEAYMADRPCRGTPADMLAKLDTYADIRPADPPWTEDRIINAYAQMNDLWSGSGSPQPDPSESIPLNSATQRTEQRSPHPPHAQSLPESSESEASPRT